MAKQKNLKMVKAILSDWDDTKVRTFPGIVKITDSFATLHKLPKPGSKGLLKFWGNPRHIIIQNLFGRHFPNLTTEELEQKYLEVVPTGTLNYPIAGVANAVQRLHQLGYLQGIVSSGPRRNIERDLDFHYPMIKQVYYFIHGAEDTSPYHKPNPKVFDSSFALLHQKGIYEENTVYVGDFYKDFQAARDRGLMFIAVINNKRSKQEFTNAGLEEKLMVTSFSQVPKLLEKLKV